MTGRHPATAAQRTELLHRMLLVRAGRPETRFGEEAVTVGLRCALGPADTLLPVRSPDGPAHAVDLATEDVLRHRPAAVVCFVGADGPPGLAGTLGLAVRERLPVLFCCADQRADRPVGCACLTGDDVDGTDVEAVTLAAQLALHPVRAGAGPRLLHLRTYADEPGPLHDPIRILADRMRTDHQLDEHALAALEQHVAAELRL
jgi:TPP-dependent pyruvate/acetoin dehydrogenase alpha subunit